MNLRIFDCASCHDRAGQPVVDGIRLSDQYDTQVRLVDLVRVNALAVPLRAPASYRVLRHELRLLLSYLPDQDSKPLGLRLGDFHASASHIRRFVTESLGLGMLTAAVHEAFRWPYQQRGLDHFDVLPIRLAGQYASTGVRPDLLFQFRDGDATVRLAGEARGRSTSRPKGHKVAAAQRRRLNELLGWSARHNLHPVTMSWAYTASAQVKVDLFRVQSPANTRPPETIDGVPTMGLAFEEDVPVGAMANQARQKAATIFDQLYRSAPLFGEGRGPWDCEMHGGWVPVDLIRPSTTHLLLGVLDRTPRSEDLARVRARQYDLRQEGEQDVIEVDVLGRLLVAVARGDGTRPPAWTEIAARLE